MWETTILMRPREQAGFTLVELVVTLALVGVLTTLAVSSPASRLQSTRGFAHAVAAELESARLRALTSRRWQAITLTDRTLEVAQASTTGQAAPTGWVGIERLTAPAGVRIVAAQAATVTTDQGPRAPGVGLDIELRFSPDGTSHGRTLWVADQRGRGVHRIAVYGATGHARVSEGW
jgi:prepilin-type N-terminal cleavage/methylation domain-containing protein